jgi:hypothetical protein
LEEFADINPQEVASYVKKEKLNKNFLTLQKLLVFSKTAENLSAFTP